MRKETPHQAGDHPQPTSRAKQAGTWLFAAIAAILFARLIWLGLRFGWWLIGWLAEGKVLERIEISHPWQLAMNGVTVVIIFTLVQLAKQEKAHAQGKHNESSASLDT